MALNRLAYPIISGLVLLAAIALGAQPVRADPAGLWIDKDGTTIKVEACGQQLCAVIVSLRPPNDPKTGRPWTDRNNSDPKLRERPLIGISVFIAMQPEGAGRWAGRLYDSDRGVIVPGHVIDVSPETLRVEGCLWMLCGGENLRRVSN
jgi:uncharacterized protein (DUF2147 family)